MSRMSRNVALFAGATRATFVRDVGADRGQGAWAKCPIMSPNVPSGEGGEMGHRPRSRTVPAWLILAQSGSRFWGGREPHGTWAIGNPMGGVSSRSEQQLQIDNVEPPAELEADLTKMRHLLEAKFEVHGDACGLVGVDQGENRAVAQIAGLADRMGE